MKFTAATFSAIAAAIPFASAHVIMTNPKQWDDSRGTAFNQYPLFTPQVTPEGAAWPCGGALQNDEIAATYAPGDEATLQLVGGATHGGGSAQMVITYDYPVSESTVWRVMQSWEGNIPAPTSDENTSNDATTVLSPFTFKVPEDLPSGKAVVAWSWNNHIGHAEHYMKCATVKIGGSNTDTSGFSSLPTMFQFNDATSAGSQCVIDKIAAIKYKNPGPTVIGTGETTVDCDNSEAGSGDSSSGGSTGSSSSAASSAAPSYAATSVATGGGSAATSVVASATGAAAATTTAASGISAPSGAVSTASAGGSGCTDGTIKCGSGETYQFCGSGMWFEMPIPAGSTCTGSQLVATAPSKRDVRFSEAHKRSLHRRHTAHHL